MPPRTETERPPGPGPSAPVRPRIGRRTTAPGGSSASPPLGVLVLVAALTGPASAQNVVPRHEDADMPSQGQIRLGVAPYFQNWHQEFGPRGSKVPLASDFEGPLLDQIHPGPGAVLDDLNGDAEALGFSPVSADEAAVGDLTVRELNTEMRSVAVLLEVGVLDRLAADLMVPVVRTEVEPFLSLDPADATLGGAAAAVPEPPAFFGSISNARTELQSRLDQGQLSPDREDEARALLQASGAFASALQRRVSRNVVLPLGGTRAGSEIEAFYGQLRSGFESFGLALPALSLPPDGDAAFLDDFFRNSLGTAPPGPVVRGWLAGESEVGVRFAVLRGFEPDEGGLQLRTTVGARARLPFRSANAQPFVDPRLLLGLPLGDGQRDLELSVYQDARIGGSVEISATVRYGLQRSDRLTMAVRSPDRPFAAAERRATVERDLGDYLRARLAPRFRFNPFFSLGLEYRYWHKGPDRFTTGDGVDVSALELETEQTRHRLGIGATYRPVGPDEGEAKSAVPNLGVIYQSAVSGSGGETPAAGLVTFHVRLPIQLF